MKKRGWLWARRLAWTLAGLVGALLLAAAMLPYWMGLAFRFLAPENLVVVESYEMLGYDRFALEGVTVHLPNGEAKVHRLEAYAPLAWALRVWRPRDAEPFLLVEGGRIELAPAARKGAAPPTPWRGLPEAARDLEERLRLVRRWLPWAEARDVLLSGGTWEATVASLQWRESRLVAEATNRGWPRGPLRLEAELSERAWKVSLRAPEPEAKLEAALQPDKQGVLRNLALEAELGEGSLLAEASFGDEGWIPEAATWEADRWPVPIELLRAGLPYASASVSTSGRWEGDRYRGRLSAVAYPKEGGEKFQGVSLPEASIELAANGDFESVAIDEFSLQAPGFSAATRKPVRARFEDLAFEGEAVFDLDLDLNWLGRDDVRGQLRGSGRLFGGFEGLPKGRFDLEGEGLVIQSVAIPAASFQLALDWPKLEAVQARLELGSETAIQAQGVADLAERRLDALSVSGSGGPALAGLLPGAPGIELEQADLEFSARGPPANLEHEGRLGLEGLAFAATRPLEGEVRWKGKMADLAAVEIEAASPEARVRAKGTLAIGTDQTRGRVESLSLSLPDGRTPALSAPADFAIRHGERFGGSLSRFRLEGDGTLLQLEAPRFGGGEVEFAARIRGFDTRQWADPWLAEPLSPVAIAEAQAEASWKGGALAFEISGDGEFATDGKTARLRGAAASEGPEIRLEGFEAFVDGARAFAAQGLLPVEIRPDETPRFRIDNERPFAAALEVPASEFFAEWVAGRFSLPARSVEASLDLEGSLAVPVGDFELSLATRKGEGEAGAPAARLVLSAAIEGSRAAVETLRLESMDSELEAKAWASLPESFLPRLLRGERLDWGASRFGVEAPEASLAPLARFAPEVLAPSGSLELSLEGSAREGVVGVVGIKNLDTRAIFPFGALRNASVDLEFSGQRATLRSFTGDLGREPFAAQGTIGYEGYEDLAMDVTLGGENLPLARQAGLLLRSDLDLALKKRPGEAAVLAGLARLRDSIFMMDATALLGGGGGRSAKTRPPYFSIGQKPFGGWKLDIAARGERFLRARTPAASGVLSADLRLEGTLAEPYMHGRVSFDEGELNFPFADFAIEQGAIELRLEDPYTPRLFIVGSSRRFGYDLQVEISGRAEDPQIRFSSNPPLSSERILLMVMAGENPEGSVAYSAAQRASKLGAYLGRSLFGGGSSDGLGSRLSFSVGDNLSRQGKETIDAEFRLTERANLMGGYDEYDAWNLGLRYVLMRGRTDKGQESEETEPEGGSEDEEAGDGS